MISTKGRYALRVMVDLASQDQGTYIPLEEIAARQEISKKYLEIVLKTLVQRKLLVGLRGKGGGYKLTRSASEYTVGEILELAEGSLAVVACLQEDANECPRREICSTIGMWERFDALVHDFFYGITLADLIAMGQPSDKDVTTMDAALQKKDEETAAAASVAKEQQAAEASSAEDGKTTVPAPFKEGGSIAAAVPSNEGKPTIAADETSKQVVDARQSVLPGYIH